MVLNLHAKVFNIELGAGQCIETAVNLPAFRVRLGLTGRIAAVDETSKRAVGLGMILHHPASEIANGVVSALLIRELRELNFGVAAERCLHQEHEIRLVSLRR